MSPFGVFPKSEPGKWRLILDLLEPEGCNVRRGMLRYEKVWICNFLWMCKFTRRLVVVCLNDIY